MLVGLVTWHLLSIRRGKDYHSIQDRCYADRGSCSPDMDELDTGSSLFYQLGSLQDCTTSKGRTLSGLQYRRGRGL